MIKEVLKNVESPFNEELIEQLIKTYVLCGCDDKVFYNKINNNDNSKVLKIDRDTDILISKLSSQGIEKSELFYADKNKTIPFIFESNSNWFVITSEEDPMKDRQFRKDRKSPIIFRFYLNLKGKDKINFIESYINYCKESEIPFEMKFSKDEERNDQIIIRSLTENFDKNLSIIEKLTENTKLGNLPMLIGNYKTGIGISEEYYNRLYSPTSAKLALIRSSTKKYICDHKDKFYNDLTAEEREIIDNFIIEFNTEYEIEKERMEKFGEDYHDIGKKYYQNKNDLECAKQHIENDSDAYICGSGLLKLGNLINKLYNSNPNMFVKEISNNFKEIGENVWGFSKNFIFTNETEKLYLTEKDSNDIRKKYSVDTKTDINKKQNTEFKKSDNTENYLEEERE